MINRFTFQVTAHRPTTEKRLGKSLRIISDCESCGSLCDPAKEQRFDLKNFDMRKCPVRKAFKKLDFYKIVYDLEISKINITYPMKKSSDGGINFMVWVDLGDNVDKIEAFYGAVLKQVLDIVNKR